MQGLKKPYNPVLGEVYRCFFHHAKTNSKTYYLAEQVSSSDCEHETDARRCLGLAPSSDHEFLRLQSSGRFLSARPYSGQVEILR